MKNSEIVEILLAVKGELRGNSRKKVDDLIAKLCGDDKKS